MIIIYTTFYMLGLYGNVTVCIILLKALKIYEYWNQLWVYFKMKLHDFVND